MTIRDDEHDPVLDALAALPAHDVTTQRAAELQQRCHSALSRGARPTPRVPSSPTRSWRQVLEPATVAVISAMYLFEVARRAFRLEGF